MRCDDVLAALFLGEELPANAAAHLATCTRCSAEAPGVRRAAELLAAAPPPALPVDLSARTMRAAEPLLARAARRDTWRAVAAALAIGLIPLPAIVFFDATLVRGAYTLLSAVLPRALSLYLVSSYAAVLVVVLGLTYAAIPILAERQVRAVRMAHG
jgi:anti-sigma factor RsiW